MLTRIWSLSVKDFIHLRNDWWLPAFMLLGGAIELLAVGWATSRPITNLPLVVLDQDKSASSRALVIQLENTGTFALQEQAYDMDIIRDGMDRGQIYAALVIPPGYASEVESSTGRPTLQVLLNGAEVTPATTALRTIEGVASRASERIMIERLGMSASDFAGFEPSMRVWFNESLSEAFYSTPAEMALMLEFTILLFAALSFSRERELGTLEQLLVMPFSSFEIIAGKAVPVIIVGFVDFVLMLGVVHFGFGVPIRGSLTLLLVLALGYILVELGKGMVISVLSRTQHQAFLLVMLVGMADFMFTGYAAPVEAMPVFMQKIALFIPANHFLNIVRSIMLKGAGLDVLWPSVLALILLGTVIIAVSWRFVRRALN